MERLALGITIIIITSMMFSFLMCSLKKAIKEAIIEAYDFIKGDIK